MIASVPKFWVLSLFVREWDSLVSMIACDYLFRVVASGAYLLVCLCAWLCVCVCVCVWYGHYMFFVFVSLSPLFVFVFVCVFMIVFLVFTSSFY